jgi:hypothetical protein
MTNSEKSIENIREFLEASRGKFLEDDASPKLMKNIDKSLKLLEQYPHLISEASDFLYENLESIEDLNHQGTSKLFNESSDLLDYTLITCF